MLKVVADDKIPFLRGALEPFAEVVYRPGAAIGAADVRDADALIVRTRTVCDEHLLHGSAVKFIATATIGHDHIDADYCARANISWRNAPGCNSSSVAQYLASTLLRLAARYGFEPAAKTLGVVGVGHVGSKVAKVGEALGMRVLLNDPPRRRVGDDAEFADIERVLAESDIITLHVPLERGGDFPTFHMVNDDFLAAVRPGAVLVNSSRGEVVDSGALRRAVKSGRLLAAVLDVWEDEPEIDLELLRVVAIGTPHIAGYSLDGKANGTSMSVNALAKHFGLPLAEWRPAGLPVPGNTIVNLDGGGGTLETLSRAVWQSYDVLADERRLRATPADFERQRGDYPLRREFHAFKLAPPDGGWRTAAERQAAETAAKLGFQGEGDSSHACQPN